MPFKNMRALMSYTKQKYIILILAGSMVWAANTSTALAQEAAEQENIVAYQPDFFSIYNPVTALDMVRQVPGFSIQDGSRARGFGSTAGNVLIDGERPNTKTTSLSDILQRIPVERVEKIELVSGAVAGLDMRGLNRVVNVTLKGGKTDNQTSWKFTISKWPRTIVPSGEIIQSFTLWKTDISIGLQRNAGSRWNQESKDFFNASDLLFEQRLAENQTNFREWQPHITMARKSANGDTANFTGKTWRWTWRRARTEDISLIPAASPEPDRSDIASSDNSGSGFEIGGDYEHKIGGDRSAKLIFFQRSDERLMNNLFETYDQAGFLGATRIISREANNESILRSVFNWTKTPKNSFELSVEGAYNSLDARLDLSRDNGSGFVPIVIPVANTRVNEKRGEAAFSWITKPTTGLTIESEFKYEISRIGQSGDAANSRLFQFLKPNFNLTWDRNKQDQIRLSVKRVVGQLNFRDFATSVDVIDDQTNIGNVELRPDSTWSINGVFERKLGKKGVFILRANRSWISDIRDLVPINNLFDAPGNIGDGTSWQISTEARLPTDRIGLSDGIFTIGGGIGDSAVTDPLTGLTREQSFRVDDYFNVKFRQELTNMKLAWGFNYSVSSASRAAFLFSDRVNNSGAGNLNAFIETTKINGVTVNLSLRNALNAVNSRVRRNYLGTRDLGVIDTTEFRRRVNGRTVRLTFRGVF